RAASVTVPCIGRPPPPIALMMSASVCMKPLVLSLLLGAWGCSHSPGNDAAPPPADMAEALPGAPVTPRSPSDHPPLWRIENSGGPVQASPAVTLVVWPGSEALAARLDRFLTWMLASDYWTGTLAEYGVGPGRNQGVVVLPTPAEAQMGDEDIR